MILKCLENQVNRSFQSNNGMWQKQWILFLRIFESVNNAISVTLRLISSDAKRYLFVSQSVGPDPFGPNDPLSSKINGKHRYLCYHSQQ